VRRWLDEADAPRLATPTRQFDHVRCPSRATTAVQGCCALTAVARPRLVRRCGA
jgi:hypothetical protein